MSTCCVQCIPESPAAESKIEPGEVIVSVDGTDCTRLTTDELADLLLGPEGETHDPSCLGPQIFTKLKTKKWQHAKIINN